MFIIQKKSLYGQSCLLQLAKQETDRYEAPNITQQITNKTKKSAKFPRFLANKADINGNA